MVVEGGKAGTSKDESRKYVRNTWDSFMSDFRTAYRMQHPNASSADVMRAGGEEWRIMLEEVMRDVEEEWSMPKEEKAPCQVKKAGQTKLDHDESKGNSDKGSNKVVNNEPKKTRATFIREGYINRVGLRRSLLSRRSVPEVHKRGQPTKYCIYPSYLH